MYRMIYKTALPDVALYELFAKIEHNGRFERTFYDGDTEKSEHGFRDLVRHDGVHFWLLLNGGQETGFVWVTNIQKGGTGNIHFCMFEGVHPLVQLRMCRFAVANILRIKDEQGEYVLEALFGITPVRNTAATRWIQKAGLIPACELPYAVFMADTGKNEPALISYVTRDTTKAEWGKTA